MKEDRRRRQACWVAEAFLQLAAVHDTGNVYGYPLHVASRVRSGVMYPLLDAWLDRGWISDGWDGDGRRFYRVTPLGHGPLLSLRLARQSRLIP